MHGKEGAAPVNAASDEVPALVRCLQTALAAHPAAKDPALQEILGQLNVHVAGGAPAPPPPPQPLSWEEARVKVQKMSNVCTKLDAKTEKLATRQRKAQAELESVNADMVEHNLALDQARKDHNAAMVHFHAIQQPSGETKKAAKPPAPAPPPKAAEIAEKIEIFFDTQESAQPSADVDDGMGEKPNDEDLLSPDEIEEQIRKAQHEAMLHQRRLGHFTELKAKRARFADAHNEADALKRKTEEAAAAQAEQTARQQAAEQAAHAARQQAQETLAGGEHG